MKAVHLVSVCWSIINNYIRRVDLYDTRFKVGVQIKDFFVMSAKIIHNDLMLQLLELKASYLLGILTKYHRYPMGNFKEIRTYRSIP